MNNIMYKKTVNIDNSIIIIEITGRIYTRLVNYDLKKYAYIILYPSAICNS